MILEDSMRRWQIRSWLWLIALALFLALSLYQLALPGPNYDEAVEAKPAVQLLQHMPIEAHRNAVIHLFGSTLPLMVVDYVGALNTYALLLYFKLGGISVVTMRLWPITVAAMVLWLTWKLGRELFGLRTGFLAAILLAVQPSFVFFARQGIYVTNTTIALMLAIWLALLRLMITGRARWFWFAAFMAGLGLWAKFIMLWPLLATTCLLPIIWLKRKELGLNPDSEFTPRMLLRLHFSVGAILAFLMGMAPFLLFNVKTGATFRHFMGTLNQSYYGVENAAYLQNLVVRWGQMKDFTRGDHFWYLGGNFADVFAWPAFLIAFVFIIVILVWRWQQKKIRSLALRALLVYAFFLLLLIQTPLTPTALWYTHLAMFSPVIALGIAAGWDLFFWQLPARTGLALAGVFLAVMLLSGLRADIGYHKTLTATGGYADHSDAVYRLSDALSLRGIYNPYALDWGFDAPIFLVSKGQVNPIEIFSYESFDKPDAGFADRVAPLLQSSDTYFLLHAPDRTNFPGRREALLALADTFNIQLETVAVIRERSGAPHTEIVHPVQNGQD